MVISLLEIILVESCCGYKILHNYLDSICIFTSSDILQIANTIGKLFNALVTWNQSEPFVHLIQICICYPDIEAVYQERLVSV